jgi:hypothetical protein
MAKGKDLQSGEIDRLLQDLGCELGARGLSPVRVMIVGGAYMLLTLGNRATTQDIDIFPLNFIDSSHPDEKTRVILTAIRAVAERNHLKRDWFNDAAYGILGGLQPPPGALRLWRIYGALEIYLPPAAFILAMKLIGYRDRDYNDVQALMKALRISSREQAQIILDTYIDAETQKEYRANVTLDDLFEE